jgi:hypothetical protein
LRLVIVKIW